MLRDYQRALVDQALSSIGNIILQAPTGSGKSLVISEIARALMGAGKKVLVLVNRLAILPSMQKAGVEAYMIQYIKNRLDKLPQYDVIIIDEVHVGIDGKMVKALRESQKKSRIIGLSATPITERGTKLEGFHKVFCAPDTAQMIATGWLAPFRYKALAVDESLDKVKKMGNDFSGSALDEWLKNNVADSIGVYEKYGESKKTMVFCNSIEHAESVYRAFRDKYGMRVGIVHSKMNGEAVNARIEDFKTDKIKILVNVSMLTIGFDEPSVECLLILRPTRILRLYLQIVGRGLRTSPGKNDCLILDASGLYQMHGLPDEPRDWFSEDKYKPREIKKQKKCSQCELVMIYAKKTRVYSCSCGNNIKKCSKCDGIVNEKYSQEFCVDCLLRSKRALLKEKRKECKKVALVDVVSGGMVKKDDKNIEDVTKLFKIWEKICKENPKSAGWDDSHIQNKWRVVLNNSRNLDKLEDLLDLSYKKIYNPDFVIFKTGGFKKW